MQACYKKKPEHIHDWRPVYIWTEKLHRLTIGKQKNEVDHIVTCTGVTIYQHAYKKSFQLAQAISPGSVGEWPARRTRKSLAVPGLSHLLNLFPVVSRSNPSWRSKVQVTLRPLAGFVLGCPEFNSLRPRLLQLNGCLLSVGVFNLAMFCLILLVSNYTSGAPVNQLVKLRIL